jgi:hypothetical protein
MRAHNPRHWSWKGTGIQSGSGLGRVLGHEYDGVVLTRQQPNDVDLLARAPMQRNRTGVPSVEITIREPRTGGFVFSANQLGVNWALANPGTVSPEWIGGKYPLQSKVNPALRGLVANVFSRALGVRSPEAQRPDRPRTMPPMKIVAPTSIQPASPGKMLVQWSEPVRGARLVRVNIDGQVKAVLPASDTTWIGTGPRTAGRHSIKLEAIGASGRVIDTEHKSFDALSYNDRRFYAPDNKYGPGLFKGYGR